jgi:hypothetical protein
VRRPMKASSAGSINGRGRRHGSSRALSARGGSVALDGSGAPAVGGPRCGFIGLLCLWALTLIGLLSSASLAIAAETCPNAAIRQWQGSTDLPDCRAYEQVSPAHKAGYDVGQQFDPAMEFGVSSSGDALTYTGDYPLPGSQAGSFAGFRAERSPAGWANAGLLSISGENQPGLGAPFSDGALMMATPDQRVSVYRDNTTAPFGSLWINRADGSRQKIVSDSALALGDPEGLVTPGVAFPEGISSDGRHVIFTDTHALVPGISETGQEILYEWVDDGTHEGAGTTRVVNRTNDPEPTLISPEAAALGAGGTASYRGQVTEAMGGVAGAVSDDGSRVFFQTPPAAYPSPGGPLFLRANGSSTIEVSAPAAGHSAATSVEFLGASVDGSLAYFWADGQLTDEAEPAGGIYRYDVIGASLSFVAPASLFGGQISAVVSASGRGILYQTSAESGEPEVRMYSDGVDHPVLQGARIVASQKSSGPFLPPDNLLSSSSAIRSDALPSAGITPDGRYAAFGTDGFDIYRYDADTSQLVRVDASPLLEPGESAVAGFSAYSSNPHHRTPVLTRVISDDGQRVFFDALKQLVPSDNNGTFDAYEWHDGTISLIGPGSGTKGSSFKGIDASGENAFFISQNRLVPQDTDELWDVYDARVNGGFQTSAQEPCSGDTCQGVPQPSPNFTSPGSTIVNGPGNPSQVGRKKHKKKRGKHTKGKHRKTHRRMGPSARALQAAFEVTGQEKVK